jgi:hypothetical protein
MNRTETSRRVDVFFIERKKYNTNNRFDQQLVPYVGICYK